MHDADNFEQSTSDYFPALKRDVNSIKEEISSKSSYTYESPEQYDSRKLKPPVMSKKCLVQENNCLKENVSKKT